MTSIDRQVFFPSGDLPADHKIQPNERKSQFASPDRLSPNKVTKKVSSATTIDRVRS